MPKVPVATQTQELQPLAPQRAFAGAEAASFGSVQGRQLQQVGSALNQTGDALAMTALRMQERQDAEAARRAFIDFDTRARALLLDPDTGLYNRRGIDAKGVTTKAAKDLEEIEREVGQSLLSPRARLAFQERAATMKSGHLDGLARHESNEFRKQEEATTEAFLNSAVEGAASAYNNPKLREQYRAQGAAEIDNMARLHGWSPELTDRKKVEFDTLFHASVIDKMLVDDPTGAQQYYDEHKGSIDGGTQVKIEKALKVGVTRERAYAEVERIQAETGSFSAQLKKAREIEDKALADEVVTRLKERHSEFDQMKARAERDAKDLAWKILYEAGSMDAIPPGVMSQLDGYTQIAMQNWVEKKGNIQTDPNLYAQFSRMVTESPQAFMDLHIPSYSDKLSPSDMQEIIGWQRSLGLAMQGDRAAAAKMDSVGTINEAITAAAKSAGLSTNAAQLGAFQLKARAEVERAQRIKGADLNQDELNQLLGRMLLQGQVRDSGVMFEDSPRYYETIGTEDQAKFYVPYDDIPQDVQRAIGAELERGGVDVTERAVEERYRLKLELPHIEDTAMSLIIDAITESGKPVTAEEIQRRYNAALKRGTWSKQ